MVVQKVIVKIPQGGGTEGNRQDTRGGGTEGNRQDTQGVVVQKVIVKIPRGVVVQKVIVKIPQGWWYRR